MWYAISIHFLNEKLTMFSCVFSHISMPKHFQIGSLINRMKEDRNSDCNKQSLTVDIQHWQSRPWPSPWATDVCVPVPEEQAAQPGVTTAPATARWPERHWGETCSIKVQRNLSARVLKCIRKLAVELRTELSTHRKPLAHIYSTGWWKLDCDKSQLHCSHSHVCRFMYYIYTF